MKAKTEKQSITLNLTSPSETDMQLMSEILLPHKFSQYWPSDTVVYHDRAVVKFNTAVIQRPSKKRPDYNIDVVDFSSSLGSGAYGRVYPISVTYKFERGEWLAKKRKPGHERCVKLIYLRAETLASQSEYCSFLNMVGSEVNFGIQIPYLSMKRPIVTHYQDVSLPEALIVMRRLPGIDLFDFYNQNPHLPIDVLLKIFINCARCVKQCHNFDIVHSDIKPENFMINPHSLEVWLMDFGFAFYSNNTNPKLAGTKIYAAPELYGDKKNKTDLLTEDRVKTLNL